ncbi:hypothetical protein Efla_000694 [Eimeria flavescens]
MVTRPRATEHDSLEEALGLDDMRLLTTFMPLATMLLTGSQGEAPVSFQDENMNADQPTMNSRTTTPFNAFQAEDQRQPLPQAAVSVPPSSSDAGAMLTPQEAPPFAGYSFASTLNKKKKKPKRKPMHPLLKELKKKYKRQKKVFLKTHTMAEFFQLKYETLCEAMKPQ